MFSANISPHLRGKRTIKLCMKYLAKVPLKTKNKNLVIFKRTLLKYIPCIKKQQIYIYYFGTKGFNF